MFRKPKKSLILIILLLQASFSQEAWGSFREHQVTKSALSKSFYGVLNGIGSVVKGMWGLTTNTGKLLWYGTREGFTKSKKADAWMRKRLW